MKKGIHPEYTECEIVCACGNKVVTRGVEAVMKLDICSACHPFFTGKQKLVDTAGRIEKFHRKYRKSSGASNASAS